VPKYVYFCKICEETIEIVHSIGQIPVCPSCLSGSLFRDYNQPFKVKVDNMEEKITPKVGEITKRYIEENREVLQEMKKESLKEIKK
jgi:hypothetical protein